MKINVGLMDWAQHLSLGTHYCILLGCISLLVSHDNNFCTHITCPLIMWAQHLTYRGPLAKFWGFHFHHYPFFISTGDCGLTLSPDKWSSQISAGRRACKSTQSGKRLICITDKIINEFLPQFY